MCVMETLWVWVCMCVCVCVFYWHDWGGLLAVPRLRYSPASGRGRGAQILHYGLIHHPRDSLAMLSVLLLLLPPSNLTSLLTAAQVPQHLPHRFHLISLPEHTFPSVLLSLPSTGLIPLSLWLLFHSKRREGKCYLPLLNLHLIPLLQFFLINSL